MTIHLNIPESWNDLNTRQLKRIALHLHANISGMLFDYRIFLTLLDVRWWQFLKKRKALNVIRNVQFKDMKKSYHWIYSTLDLTSFIPKIKVRSVVLNGPADRINNLTVDEFAHADDLYLGWFTTKDFEYLRYLLVVLYRESDHNGKRIVFDKSELDKRAKSLSNIDRKTLLAVLLSYQGSRSYLIRQFPLVFPKQKTETKTPKSSGFGKLVLYLSGGKFGTYNETKNTNIYTFLAELEEQLKKKSYA